MASIPLEDTPIYAQLKAEEQAREAYSQIFGENSIYHYLNPEFWEFDPVDGPE